jgi:putative ABC transport system permease protein
MFSCAPRLLRTLNATHLGNESALRRDGLALVVAIARLYALLAVQVADRTREIGIRMALGARRGQIAELFALRTLREVATGFLAGLLTAFVASGTMTPLLFGVTPTGPSTYGIVCVLLLVAAIPGAAWPITRATAVDPMVALRHE